MSRSCAPLAISAVVVAGCFVDPGTDGPQTAAASTGELTGAPSTGADPTDSASTGAVDPTTGEPPAPMCGDAIQDPDEQCDLGADQNGVDGAFCRGDCTTNLCGDAYLASTEGCDDGNIKPGDGCSPSCTLESCGDGVVGDAEECDDGNQVDTDACTGLCKLPRCGDGIVSRGEACDDGNRVDGDGCNALCQQVQCGDGIVEDPEECDDGNLIGLDGCDPICKRDAYRVFVTSTVHMGDLGGLAAADEICQTRAGAAGLAGTFYAWLSVDGIGPGARFLHSTLPYILVDGTVVADDYLDLTDGNLDHAIERTEIGVQIGDGGCDAENAAWTATKANGNAVGDLDCNGWTEVQQLGRVGEISATSSSWSNSCSAPCTAALHLYCFEQAT